MWNNIADSSRLRVPGESKAHPFYTRNASIVVKYYMLDAHLWATVVYRVLFHSLLLELAKSKRCDMELRTLRVYLLPA